MQFDIGNLHRDQTMFKITLKTYLAIIAICLFSSSVWSSDKFSFRKYEHVKTFYQRITPAALEVSEKYQLPAAAVLAIAGLESGYGSGYVSKITGNILSLGAFSTDNELPSLYLPYSASMKRVLFDPIIIKQQSDDDLAWKQRPESLKRDYRPLPYAGTSDKLAMLKYDKSLRAKAHKACFEDFASRWIISSSKVDAFKNARLWLDDIISKKGMNSLYSNDTNTAFIDKVGGHPRSFNHRESWPKKVKLIMRKAGLVKLVEDIKINNLSFDEAWKKI